MKSLFLFLFVQILLLLEAHSLTSMLYKKMEFPISQASSIFFEEHGEIEFNIACASMCSLDSNACNSYVYVANTKVCSFINFGSKSENYFSVAESIYGYVDYGWYFYAIFVNHKSVNKLIIYLF